MSAYQAPLRDMQFALREIAGFDEIVKLPGFEEAGEYADAVLEQAGEFATEVLDPLNASGDKQGAVFEGGNVRMPKGYKEAYHKFAEAGWIGLPMPPEFGGQGLPQTLSTATLEMWNAAALGFSLGPLLNQGAIEAIILCGTEEQKKTYVPKLVSGEWTGTMVLTEPQAGSDLGLVRTTAVPEGDHYRITGNKIFITYGEHDMTDNIVHLVLARTPGAPEGVKGISLFIVPKMLVNADGSLGERNDVQCASIEHKLGIHASPTAVLNYGEKGGAIGYLIGEENKGLSYMFIMMNLARFSVGVQGIAIADRAYQSALSYAKERVQGKELTAPKDPSTTIVHHPDVRRMLMQMKSQIEAMRALAFWTAAAIDKAHASDDEAVKTENNQLVELFTPIVKGWCTEASIELVSTALQVFGGMGFIEETGVAQFYRDVRIVTIYEGTTAIQANDLLGRKFLKDGGKVVTRVIGQMQKTAAELEASGNDELIAIGHEFKKAVGALGETSMWLGGNAMKGDLNGTFAGSVPYLKLWGIVSGGWMMAMSALVAASKSDDAFYAAKIVTARFYADHVLNEALALKHEITKGSTSVMALTEEQFELDRKSLALA